MPVRFTHLSNIAIYGTNTSQGSVAARCGGILNDHFTANFLENLLVKKLKIS